MLRLSLGILLILSSFSLARDPTGQYAQSPNRDWFNSLHSNMGLCCAFADAYRVDDVDWEQTNDPTMPYRVKLCPEMIGPRDPCPVSTIWYDVPKSAVVESRNQVGYATVWPVYYDTGLDHIRCFIPGTET